MASFETAALSAIGLAQLNGLSEERNVLGEDNELSKPVAFAVVPQECTDFVFEAPIISRNFIA